MTDSENSSPTEVLRLFREDLDMSDRVRSFEFAAGQIREEVDNLATSENVQRINESFDIQFIFNSHGDAVDAGQSVGAISNPFITFVESAGATDISENYLFSDSLSNAFNIRFNQHPPTLPKFQLTRETAWEYWRDRGLLAKGSVIMPVDIRHYSRRLLDALMGTDYDQQYLSSSIGLDSLRSGKPFTDVLEEQKQKGQLIMFSNAVRELTSTKQIVETLLMCLDNESDKVEGLDDHKADMLRAVMQKQRMNTDKLPAYIIYGSGHHTMMHIFRDLGLSATRDFPGKVDAPTGYSFAGDIKGQFFSAHHFGLTDSQIDRYAKQHIIESILWAPIDLSMEYGLVPFDDDLYKTIWHKIMKIARNPDLVDRAQNIYDDFQQDASIPVRILEDHGIKLRNIASS